MKYIIYVRVSSEKQDVEMQKEKCFEKVRHAAPEDILVLSEDALSTSIAMEKRPQLQKMFGLLGKNVTVVVYAIDRLSRDVYELSYIRKKIKERGAHLISCNEGSSNLEMNIKAAFAQEEKERIIQRTVDDLQVKAKKMERVGKVWYGYSLDQTTLQTHKPNAKSYGKPYLLIPNEEEQRNIQIMIDLKKQGYGLLRICNHLTSLGYMNRAGKPFQLVAVSRILHRMETGSHPVRKSYRKYRTTKSQFLAEQSTL